MWAENAFLLHINVFSACAARGIHKMPFGSLVFESWAAAALPLDYWSRCMRIIVDLNSATFIGECEEIGGDTLCHDYSFLAMISVHSKKIPIANDEVGYFLNSV